MLRRSSRRVAAACGFLVILIAGIARLGAHGPLDNSVVLYVEEDRLEVGITLGTEAARRALEYSGLAPAAVDEMLLNRGPSSFYDFEVDVASALFELSAGSGLVVPTRARVHSDGLEVLFAIEYPRVRVNEAKVQALYFEASEELPPGGFVVLDGNRNALGAATFSRMNPTAGVQLPSMVTVAAVAGADSTMQPPVREASARNPSPSPASPENAAPSLLPWLGWALGGVLLGAALWIAVGRIHRTGLHSRQPDS